MKKEVRTTKSGYPLMRYLSLLLALALLFSGVTFARYALERRGSIDTGVALFDASYTVEGVNSLTFGNQSYWMNYSNKWYEQGEGSARTVRIGMRNNSDVEVRANVLHMEGPAEFWENIALQLTTVKSNPSSDSSSDNPDGVAADQIITTQYVLADFLRVRQGGTTEDKETHGYTYGAYQQWGESGTFNTKFSDEFGQRGSGDGRCRIARFRFQQDPAVQSLTLQGCGGKKALLFIADDHGRGQSGHGRKTLQRVLEQRMAAQVHELLGILATGQGPQACTGAPAQDDGTDLHVVCSVYLVAWRKKHRGRENGRRTFLRPYGDAYR